MALSGLDIYKLLPKTNCKKCGSPTCLAFAMKLAMKKASLDQCPDVTEEAKKELDQASRPPIAVVTVGSGDKKVETGGETVLFRHEKTFYRQTAIAITVDDELSEEGLIERMKEINSIAFERIGIQIGIDLIAVVNSSKSAEKFAAAVNVVTKNSDKPLVFVTEDIKAMEEALKVSSDKKPLLYGLRRDTLKSAAGIIKQHGVPVVLKSDTLEGIDSLSREAVSLGLESIMLDTQPAGTRQAINDFTQIRRLSLKKNHRPMGFPVASYLRSGEDKFETVKTASTYIAKYCSLLVLDTAERDVLLPLITLRQNIYTDPQKPITVEAKLYSIGPVNENSPVMVTTNFSLTFYTVSPEIEASKKGAYLLVTDSDGMSVLTAWAAEKFTPEIIAESMKKFETEKAVSHKKIIIPGYVSVLSGKLEDTSGWEVLVGPKEASAIPKYLKEVWK